MSQHEPADVACHKLTKHVTRMTFATLPYTDECLRYGSCCQDQKLALPRRSLYAWSHCYGQALLQDLSAKLAARERRVRNPESASIFAWHLQRSQHEAV